MSNLLSFERFERIIKTIQSFDKKRDRVSDFFEEEIIEGRCMLSYGEDIVTTLIYTLADEYDCWHGTPQTSFEFREGQFVTVPSKNRGKEWWNSEGIYYADNDIQWWLYECHDNKKIVEIDGVEHDLTDLKKFHEFLLGQMKN